MIMETLIDTFALILPSIYLQVDDEPLPLNFTYITEPVESHTVSIMKDLLTVKVGLKFRSSTILSGFAVPLYRVSQKKVPTFENSWNQKHFTDLNDSNSN